MKQIIYGKAPSKSNCYMVVTIGGHGSLAKTKAIKDYEKKFLSAMQRLSEQEYNGEFIDVYYP